MSATELQQRAGLRVGIRRGGGRRQDSPGPTATSPHLHPPADPLRPPPTCTVSATMVACVFRGLLLVGLLTVMCHGQASQEDPADDFGVEKAEPAADRDLVSTPTHA